MARTKQPDSRPHRKGPQKRRSTKPNDIGPFPAKWVNERFKKYTEDAGYHCNNCQFQTEKKDKAGRQAMRAHKRRHLRERKARRRGILAALLVVGPIIAAIVHLLDATRYLPLVAEHLCLILLALLGILFVAFGVSVAVLNERSIRREFYRTLMILVPMGGSVGALMFVGPPDGPVHPQFPLAVLWAPVIAALGVTLALPKLAATWNTSGLNPRLRPEYQKLAQFTSRYDRQQVEELIVNYEYEAVTGRTAQLKKPVGNRRALRELREAKHLRSMLITLVPIRLDMKRGDCCGNDREIMSKMAKLEL